MVGGGYVPDRAYIDGTRGTGGGSGDCEGDIDGVIDVASDDGPGERERDGERRLLDGDRLVGGLDVE